MYGPFIATHRYRPSILPQCNRIDPRFIEPSSQFSSTAKWFLGLPQTEQGAF